MNNTKLEYNLYCILKYNKKILDRMMLFEIDPLKTNSKLESLEEDINLILNEVKLFENNNMKSINKNVFFYSFSAIYLKYLYKRKTILSYMGLYNSSILIIKCIFFSGIISCIIGYKISNNLNLYYKLYKFKKDTITKLLEFNKRYSI